MQRNNKQDWNSLEFSYEGRNTKIEKIRPTWKHLKWLSLAISICVVVIESAEFVTSSLPPLRCL